MGQHKMKPDALGRQDLVHAYVILKKKYIYIYIYILQYNCSQNNFITKQFKPGKILTKAGCNIRNQISDVLQALTTS